MLNYSADKNGATVGKKKQPQLRHIQNGKSTGLSHREGKKKKGVEDDTQFQLKQLNGWWLPKSTGREGDTQSSIYERSVAQERETGNWTGSKAQERSSLENNWVVINKVEKKL